MQITEMLLTPNKYSRPQIKLEHITKIAIHYVGNPKSTAKNNRDYFENLKNTHATYVSSHFVIGLDGEVIQCIPLDEWSYCTNQANGYSISIECCHPDSSGKFNNATEDSLVELCVYLCEKFGLTADDIIRHYDVTGKKCPLWYVNHSDDYEAFKQRVKAALAKEQPSSAQGGNSTPKYYVQVGAFSSKANAEKYLESVKKTYPNAFIKTL